MTYHVYTDGSYVSGEKCCGYAAVFTLDGKVHTIIYGNRKEPRYTESRNIGGEIEAVLCAVDFARECGVDKMVIHHDYIGLSKWVSGEWKCNKPLTIDYANMIRAAKAKLKIDFIKVAAHSNDQFNDMADKYANRGRSVAEECVIHYMK